MGCSCRRSHLSYCQKENTSTTGKIGGSLSISRETIPNPVRKRSDFNQALSTLNRLQPRSWRTTARAHILLEVQGGGWHRVLPPLGGNGENPGVLPKNSKKVKKEVACKGLRSNGATRCLQNFGENFRRVAFKNSFYFVTARSFTADGGLL